uniref:Uncharacterized protein n=1 Tax=viral metagenome TaxID=1070528 RepID=A0A6C0CH04_9ZZZZ
MTTLFDLVTKPECYGFVDTLIVDWLRDDRWKFRHQIGLAKLLNKHRVKILVFLPNIVSFDQRCFDLLAGDNQNDDKFVPIHYLKRVEIDTRQFRSFMTTFVEWSRASSVIYRISDTSKGCERRADWYSRDYPGLLKDNFSLRKMTFFQDVGLYPPQVINPECLNYKAEVLAVQAALHRNKKAFRKCQKAVVALLGMRKNKVLNLNRDVFSIVINMVWSSCGLQVWIV